MAILQFFNLHDGLYQLALASARLMPAFIMLPFFNTNILSGAIRLPVAMLIGMSLFCHPNVEVDFYPSGLLFILIFKELTIGLAIGFFLCLPYWVLHAVGSLIDNQRGATLSSSIDPLSGVDTSELANFLHLFAAVIVLQHGGLILLLDVYQKSYQLWQPWQMTMPELRPVLHFLTLLVGKSLILASPIVIVFLLTELCLGLLGRFAPQLNAFALALTVKSIIAFLMLIIYFQPLFPEKIQAMFFFSEILSGWSTKLF